MKKTFYFFLFILMGCGGEKLIKAYDTLQRENYLINIDDLNFQKNQWFID